MYKITKLSEPYIKETPRGYAIWADVNGKTPIMLDWFYSDRIFAEKGLEYVKQVILEKEKD